ncbi:MAG TPA: glucose-1-phosphate adenylyltransferase subunit GlgD [Patescibacteria group bacterium]|nr:glucose-1-phosphate adenylyltransferase subunit GlgD [Patescibacteria group bacterium]
MILAGGTGRELSVLTQHRAKTALPFGGRYRIIDFCLSNCVHSGFHDIAVLAQYNPKSLIDHIKMGKPWDLDRKNSGVYILQPTHHGEMAQWYLGTGDALYQNIDVIRSSNADLVLVLSGDQVYGMDYRRMVVHHRSMGKPVTIAYKEVSPSQRSRFGMIRCSRRGLVTAFQEKPSSSPFRFASLGIYLFDREFLIDYLRPERVDIVFDIIMPMLTRRRVAGYEFDGYWEDIGSVMSYYRASRRLLRNRSIITDRAWPIYTRGAELPPASFSRDSVVMDSIIADGCSVRGTVRGSILFPGVRIAAGATVENSIIFSFASIGNDAVVGTSIIDKEVRVGAGAQIGERAHTGEPDIYRIEGIHRTRGRGITVVGKAARIAAGVGVPRGAVVEARTVVDMRRIR